MEKSNKEKAESHVAHACERRHVSRHHDEGHKDTHYIFSTECVGQKEKHGADSITNKVEGTDGVVG